MTIVDNLEFNLSIERDIGLNDHAAIIAVETPVPAPISLVLYPVSKTLVLVDNCIVAIRTVLGRTSQTKIIIGPNASSAPPVRAHATCVTMLAASRRFKVRRNAIHFSPCVEAIGRAGLRFINKQCTHKS